MMSDLTLRLSRRVLALATITPMSKLAEQRVYLHLGAPKTGTTYLQDVLWRNRKSLAQAGVLYPGDRPDAHFRAALDLQANQFQDWADPDVRGSWERLVTGARQWPGTTVLSHELFCTAGDVQIARVLSDLAFAEVHLVCTARDLARQLPAVWQEDLKNRHVVSFTQLLQSVSGNTESPHWLSEVFWDFQDLPRILDRWSRAIPPHRVHVVTVPPPEQSFSLLWHRFSELLGINAEDYDTSGGALNTSLGVAEAELVHRLNKALADQLSWPQYHDLIKGEVANRILGRRKPRTPLELPDEHRTWVHERSTQLVTELTKAEYDVRGDLRDLVPSASPQATHHPDDPDDKEVLEVAVEAMAGLVQRVAADRSKPGPPPAPQGVRKTLSHLGEQHVVFSRLRDFYRRLMALLRR